MTTSTLANYRTRAAQGEEPYASFVLDAEQAAAMYVCERLQAIDAAGMVAATAERRDRGDYRAIAWILERLHPKDFAITSKGEVHGEDRAFVGDAPTPQDAAALVRRMFGDQARRALLEDPDSELE